MVCPKKKTIACKRPGSAAPSVRRRFWSARLVAGFICVAGFVANPAPGESGDKDLIVDLETAVRIGVANNVALRAIDYKKEAVKKLITERWRTYLPSLGVSFDRSRTIVDGTTASASGSIVSTSTDVISNEIRVTLNQVIYDGGQRDLDLDLARIDAILTSEDFRLSYNRLRLDIQNTFLEALAAYGKIELNQRSLERARYQLRQTKLEEQVGFTTRVQVLTVAARVREIELRLERARNAYTQAIHRLKRVMNLDFEVGLRLRGDLFRDFFLEAPGVALDGLVQRARSLRPEYKRSLAAIHRLKKEKDIAENYWIPQFSVGGYVGRRGETFPLREDTWGVNFAVTFPIGPNTTSTNSGVDVARDGSSRTGTTNTQLNIADDLGYERRLLEKKSDLAEALAEHDQLDNTLAIEVNSAHDSLRESWEAIRIGNGRVYFQYASIRILETSYKVGAVRRADIVDAEVELVEAQEELTDSIASYLTAVHELEFSAAMDPGTLELFRLRRGIGNTLPGKILDGDLDQIEQIGKRFIDPNEIRDLLESEEEPDNDLERLKDSDLDPGGKEDFEIDKVEID
jgi:outer membrane protein TolC